VSHFLQKKKIGQTYIGYCIISEIGQHFGLDQSAFKCLLATFDRFGSLPEDNIATIAVSRVKQNN
jgi:hypothetical protein